MSDEEPDVSRGVNRRNFLTLGGFAAAMAATGWPLAGQAQARAAAPPGVPLGGGEADSLDTGPIGREAFEAARARAAQIVSQLTLEEKISQFGTRVPAIARLNLPAFNFYSGEALHGLMYRGRVTSFPLPLAMGCSWNPQLVHRVFTAVSDEAWAWHKIDGQKEPTENRFFFPGGLTFFSPPTVNMGTRDPRWGRIAENYAEDTLLVGKLGAAAIHGMQGDDPRFLKTICCAKHFICNDTEDDRETASASVDPRSFWEYYSRGFEYCVREGKVFTVMAAYNSLNGIPCAASRFLLTDLLRRRWGFRGYVVSDCDSIGDITRTHHFVPTYAEAAALAVNAGCDINCGDTLQRYLGEAVNQMLISEEVLDHSLVRSFTGRILLGDLDPPGASPYHAIDVSCRESPAHRQLCREIGRQSIVLFKNEQRTLPLDPASIRKLAVIGPLAEYCYLGNYSGRPTQRISPLDGMLDQFGIPTPPRPPRKDWYENWSDHFGPHKYDGPPSMTFSNARAQVTYAIGCTMAGAKEDALWDAALEAARGADAALLFLGDNQQIDHEAHDRTYLHLPGMQHELAKAVHAVNPKTILVIVSNCPVAVIWEQEHLPAIVGGMFLGQEQGHALADVIFGAYNPGGKVSTTWYRHADDLPGFHNYDIRLGRTYMYFQGVPLYPFGHGLSYTSFAYSDLRVRGEAVRPGGQIELEMRLSNTGDRAGDEVVQFYVHVAGSTVQRPIKQLVGFERVHLAAGASRIVRFTLAHSDPALCYWDERRYRFVIEPGTVELMLGASSADIRLRSQVQLQA
jgi:beta-glucosidase